MTETSDSEPGLSAVFIHVLIAAILLAGTAFTYFFTQWEPREFLSVPIVMAVGELFNALRHKIAEASREN